jgi:hypothetical protein
VFHRPNIRWVATRHLARGALPKAGSAAGTIGCALLNFLAAFRTVRHEISPEMDIELCKIKLSILNLIINEAKRIDAAVNR